MSTTSSSSSPNSSVKSSSSPSAMNTPACRRDANCTCKICQGSINATLDLLPLSAQRSTLTKLSSSKPKPSPPETPLFINNNNNNPSIVSTPESETSSLIIRYPKVKSTTRTTDFKLRKKKKSGFGCGLGMMMMMKCVVVLCLSLVVKLGLPYYVGFRFMESRLSPEVVRSLSEKVVGFRDVKEQLGFLNDELRIYVGDRSKILPNWEVIQDGLMLRSQCQLYKSGIEEVSIWGWPLQTSGLVTTDFASRSFTILSGRVTEWLNGESSGLIRTANTSWEQEKWSTSVWRLDENTWIVEYKRSFVFDNTRPVSSTMEFLRFKMMRSFHWMKQMCKLSDDNHLAPT
ncbi:uncharacterized protein LOC143633779 [Bidens hawaiensis]|uniref:uncharacterized protein LOC143633779 n=1 Tax=Bidens hawaiensis TaxID=980011 RepID=UPI00404902AE